jgi:hypothetical protein
MPKNNKIPKWVLLDQMHIDIYIQSDLPQKERKWLMSVLDRLLQASISGGDPRIRVKITR